jgi:hypothetical protein
VSGAQLAALGETTRLLADGGVEHWVFGGWAVDLHAGRISREHSDLDVVVRGADHRHALALLRDAGWEERAYEFPAEGSRHERACVRLELTLVERAGDGSWRTPGRWIDYPWPPDPFGTTTRTLAGVTCPVVELHALVALKETFIDVGDRFAEARDAQDLALLRDLAD